MKKPTLKERFSYWFDKRMEHGSLSLIKLLAVVSLVIVVVISFLIFILGFNEEGGFRSAFWNSLATIINSWMPYFEDGSPGYLILTAIAALVGLLITSILIGIIASAIEEKVNDLKRGNSRVLEEGHVVVLGFCPGEYTLIRQLVLAAGDEPACIVVASDQDQEEIEQGIRENVDTPRNVRIICRTIDIFDATSLEKCSVSSCRVAIVSPTDDLRTTKALLATIAALKKANSKDVRICAIVSGPEYSFPATIAEKYNMTIIRSSEMIAKIIAHSCTQPGLSDSFRELFGFEGSELYSEAVEGSDGRTFGELLLQMEGGVPVGLQRGGKLMLNLWRSTPVEAGDKVLFFAESGKSVRLRSAADAEKVPGKIPESELSSGATLAILGGNDSLPTVLRELPESIGKVVIAADRVRFGEQAEAIAKERGDLSIEFEAASPAKDALERLMKRAAHVVVLAEPDKEDDEADMCCIMRLLTLRDIHTRFSLSFNVTAEMRREYNHKLLMADDSTDFIVSSSICSLILAQAAVNPKLISAYTELLSNDGNEVYLKPAAQFACCGRHTVEELRRIAMAYGYIMIGYRKAELHRSRFNPALDETLELAEEDSLIVIGES